MRRLTEIAHKLIKRLQLRAQDQHIADLQEQLSSLVAGRSAIEDAIDSTVIRLLDAKARRDQMSHEGIELLPVDRQFPDPAPRSY